MEKREKRRIVKWVALGLGIRLLVVTIVLLVVVFKHDSQIEYGSGASYRSQNRYAKELGVDDMYYKYFYAAYGSPERMEYRYDEDTPRMLAVAYYPRFELHCVVLEQGPPGCGRYYLGIICLSVTDPELRFGRARIGLGSTRAEVEEAYKGNRPLEERHLQEYLFPVNGQYADAGYAVDKQSRILFFYDEADHVETMLWESVG